MCLLFQLCAVWCSLELKYRSLKLLVPTIHGLIFSRWFISTTNYQLITAVENVYDKQIIFKFLTVFYNYLLDQVQSGLYRKPFSHWLIIVLSNGFFKKKKAARPPLFRKEDEMFTKYYPSQEIFKWFFFYSIIVITITAM